MAFLFMSMTGKLRNISTARDCPASAVVQASPLLWQTAPGEQTSPGDHGVQFNVKIADLLRRYSGLVTAIQVFDLTHVYDAIIPAQHRVI